MSQNGTIAVPHDNRHVRLYDLNGTRVGRLPRSNRVVSIISACRSLKHDLNRIVLRIGSYPLLAHITSPHASMLHQ